MGNYRPIPTDCWVRFLKSKNCYPKSVNSSHHKWRCPNCVMSIIFWENKKEVPFAHITTCLQTMKISKQEFLDWLKNNCWNPHQLVAGSYIKSGLFSVNANQQKTSTKLSGRTYGEMSQVHLPCWGTELFLLIRGSNIRGKISSLKAPSISPS